MERGGSLFNMKQARTKGVDPQRCSDPMGRPGIRFRASSTSSFPTFPHARPRGRRPCWRWRVKISAGRPVGLETQGSGTALLRSGRVTLREASFISRGLHDASMVDLNAGDFFRVAQVNPEGLASGFIVADERPAMTVAFRIARKKATITRPGGVEFPMASDIFSRFANDVEL